MLRRPAEGLLILRQHGASSSLLLPKLVEFECQRVGDCQQPYGALLADVTVPLKDPANPRDFPPREIEGFQHAKRVTIAPKEAGQKPSTGRRTPAAHAGSVLSCHAVKANTPRGP